MLCAVCCCPCLSCVPCCVVVRWAVCLGCVLCVLGACGCVLRQLNDNCITQPSQAEGHRTKDKALVQGACNFLFWKARVMHSSVVSCLMSSLSLFFKVFCLVTHTKHALTHTERQHATNNNTKVNEHTDTQSHEHAQTHEQKQTRTQLATVRQSYGKDKVTVEYKCTCPDTHFHKGSQVLTLNGLGSSHVIRSRSAFSNKTTLLALGGRTPARADSKKSSYAKNDSNLFVMPEQQPEQQ